MKPEFRKSKSERSPKPEARRIIALARLFGFRHPEFFRDSDFGFRISRRHHV